MNQQRNISEGRDPNFAQTEPMKAPASFDSSCLFSYMEDDIYTKSFAKSSGNIRAGTCSASPENAGALLLEKEVVCIDTCMDCRMKSLCADLAMSAAILRRMWYTLAM